MLAYVRTDDGFLTTMHDAVPSLIHTHRAPTFNPGSNADQMSSLRLVNPGEEDAEVMIVGIDGDGVSPGSGILVTVSAKASMTLTSQEMESGGVGFEGALAHGGGVQVASGHSRTTGTKGSTGISGAVMTRSTKLTGNRPARSWRSPPSLRRRGRPLCFARN